MASHGEIKFGKRSQDQNLCKKWNQKNLKLFRHFKRRTNYSKFFPPSSIFSGRRQ